ncbi:MAG: ABC transporter permease [Oscillibacter sp.]|nr:ABC transporter permease [Oscillibacter sp.]
MPLKRSCFNRTLFQKHLNRFWPLWGGVSLVGAMVPLYIQLTLMQNMGSGIADSSDFRYTLYQLAAYFVPAFTCVYAIFCVMAVWGYLYNARSVGLMHTLPVDRTCLFITNTLAAVVMQLIPFAVTGGLICLIALGWGFFDVVGVVNTILAVLFCTLLFTGMGTLCAMLTGHAVVLPVFYLLANFLAFLMELLVTNLAHIFLIGVPMLEGLGRLTFLSPIVKLYNSSYTVESERLLDGSRVYHLRGLWVVALYALAGLALLALSWFLYRRRHSESAGDVVAFRWLRPIFRYGVALLSALTIGRLLYELLWREIFQKGDYADPLPMAVCLFLAGLLGYYAASMLLAKSRRVFGKKSLPGVGVVAAGAAAVCLLVSVDLFGLERKIPEWDEIESVTISGLGVSSIWNAGEYPEQVMALREFHQAIVNDRSYIRSYVPDGDREGRQIFSHYITLDYQLKDGTNLLRQYDLWMEADRVGTAGTFENLLDAFYRDPEVRSYDVRIPAGATLEGIDVYSDYMSGYHINTLDHADGDNRETEQLYAALQKDAAQGNIPAKNILQRHEVWYSNNFKLSLYYRVYDTESRGGYYRYRNKEVYLSPSMTNTIDALLELEYITPEGVELWKQDLAEREKDDDGLYGGVIYPETRAVYSG